MEKILGSEMSNRKEKIKESEYIKLEKNMYIRTHFGIRKIKNIKKDNGYGKPRVKVIELDRILDTMFKLDYEFYTDEKVIKECKASYNLIDLIEFGDYLNGFKVSKIERYDTKTIIKIGNSTFNVLEGEKIYTPSYDNNNGYGKIEKLKSIVTHEQIEQIAYKVGE